VFIEVIPAPNFGANTDSVICLPDSFLFYPNTNNQSNLRFVWLGETDTLSMSDFPQTFWVDSSLSRQLIAFMFSGCYDTLDVQLRVKEADVLPNTAFELKQSCEGLLLEIFPENNTLWFVNGVLQTSNNLKVNPGDTLMKVVQSPTEPCFAKEQIRLGGEGAQNQLADLANVFTPNRDGINDVFGPKNPSDFLCAELKIYNRWGLLVFQSKVGSPPVWDGRSPSALELPEGVYFYTFSIGEQSQQGSVNLMR
jgi:gliding motility-associated-like protein